MPLEDILQKIGQLSAEERDALRRELDSLAIKPATTDAAPETVDAINRERTSANEERGVPIEDVIEPLNSLPSVPPR